jgi:hypothetical protein
MPEHMRFRYSTTTLFWVVAAIAVPLGLSMSWTPFSSLLICSAVALVLWCWTRRRTAGACLLTYVALLPFAFIATFIVINPSHPYVRRYNERLERLATESRLIDSAEERVQIVLGNPTFIDRGWDRRDSETGDPVPGAEFRTTYNYAPYPSFPFAVFQVHCRDGIVQGIELYDY